MYNAHSFFLYKVNLQVVEVGVLDSEVNMSMTVFFQSINQDPGYLYVVIRVFVLFLFSVVLVRYGSRRFHLNTPLDLLLVIILGGLISRGINGTTTLASTLIAVASLIAFHKILARMSFLLPSIEAFLKGKSHLLIKDGKIVLANLKHCNITEHDLMEQLHQQLHTCDYKNIQEAYLERNGVISFIQAEK